MVWVTTALISCGSARNFCSALSVMAWKTELCKAFPNGRLTTVSITDIFFLFGFDPVTRPASRNSHTTASRTRTGVLIICWSTVSFSRDCEQDWVRRSIVKDRFSEKGLSASLSNMSSLSDRPLPLVRSPMIEVQMAGLDKDCGTLPGGNSVAVMEYMLRITDHDKVFVSFVSAGVHILKSCQTEIMKRKITRRAGPLRREMML